MDSIEHSFISWKCPRCHKEWTGPKECEFCPLCGAVLKKKGQERKQNPKKRGNGQGSVYKLRNGKWRAAITVGLDEQRRPQRVTRTGFASKSDALAYIAKLKDDAVKKQDMSPLRAVYSAFIATHKRSQSTLDCYAAAYKYLRKLHNRPFRNISVDDWQSCIDKCKKGRRTKENIRALISLLYKYAIPRNLVDPELMTFKGEFLKIYDAPSDSQKTGFTQQELGVLWDHKEDPMVATILVMCYTGFRLGEFLNVEYKDGCLYGGSKTKAGKNRVVPLPQKIECLWSYCRKHTDEKQFRSDFYDTLERLGIENAGHRLTPHSTRHTFATLLKDAHGSDKDKMALIGHNSSEMLRYYQDSELQNLREIMDQL